MSRHYRSIFKKPRKFEGLLWHINNRPSPKAAKPLTTQSVITKEDVEGLLGMFFRPTPQEDGR
jgi:hypothetical protein